VNLRAVEICVARRDRSRRRVARTREQSKYKEQRSPELFQTRRLFHGNLRETQCEFRATTIGRRSVFSILFQAIDDKFTETLRDDESLKDEGSTGLTLPRAANF
jgi:hypothetical protein